MKESVLQEEKQEEEEIGEARNGSRWRGRGFLRFLREGVKIGTGRNSQFYALMTVGGKRREKKAEERFFEEFFVGVLQGGKIGGGPSSKRQKME